MFKPFNGDAACLDFLNQNRRVNKRPGGLHGSKY
jgi:hypothetical protein